MSALSNSIFSRILRASFLLGFLVSHQDVFSQSFSLFKVADDDDRQFTNVGNLALTISNFGTLGTRNRYWPSQPSCEYPKGSRIEHLYQAGLWVGAFSHEKAQYLVSTGVTDRSGTSGAGYEFTSELGEGIIQRSTLSDSRFFDENAVSHQDFVAEYSDKNTRVPSTGDSILFHQPLGISVRQESYAWNFPFADFFVIVSYTIVNTGTDTLDDVHVGLWANCVVRNTNAVRPGSTGYFNDGGNGYDSLARSMYTFEYANRVGGVPADSYIGIKLLGTNPFPVDIDSLADLYTKTYYNAWGFRAEGGIDAYQSPVDDDHPNRYLSRYKRMTQSMPKERIDPLRLTWGNYTTLLSTGPWEVLYPGDTVQVVFAVACGKKVGTEPERFDTPTQRGDLMTNLGWAQQTYDAGYELPAPPRQPRVRAVVQNQKVEIYWDRDTAEETIDRITNQKKFEGYRIYRSQPGADFRSPESFLLNMNLVGEFDSTGNDVGYNTGFSAILLPEARVFERDVIQCITTNGDTIRCILGQGDESRCSLDATNIVSCDTIRAVRYWYRFPPEGSNITHLNGWQYLYGVSAFDRGDPENNLPILESAMVLVRVVPGTSPTSDESKPIGVYPNPYYSRAYWDGDRERTRKIYFFNLPARCSITIYTVAGDVVAELDHDADNSGQEIEWFEQFGVGGDRPQFSGGEHAWDLITKFDQALATGLYLFSVKDRDSGTVKTGKFAVIK